MLLPTQSTRSEGSFHGSSRYAAAEDIQDTAMSVADIHTIPGSVAIDIATSASGGGVMPGSTAKVSSTSPNTTFQRSHSRGRTWFVLPIIQHVRSLGGFSVAQRCAQLAEQIAASAISGIGQMAAGVQTAQGVAQAALSEVASVRGQVEERI